MQWMEEAEARQVLAIAQSESPSESAPLAIRAPWIVRLRRLSLFGWLQQIGKRGDVPQMPEIADLIETGIYAVRPEAGQRHQRMKLGVDVRPVDAKHARPSRRIDGAGKAPSVERADDNPRALPILMAIVGGRRPDPDLVD